MDETAVLSETDLRIDTQVSEQKEREPEEEVYDMLHRWTEGMIEKSSQGVDGYSSEVKEGKKFIYKTVDGEKFLMAYINSWKKEDFDAGRQFLFVPADAGREVHFYTNKQEYAGDGGAKHHYVRLSQIQGDNGLYLPHPNGALHASIDMGMASKGKSNYFSDPERIRKELLSAQPGSHTPIGFLKQDFSRAPILAK